MPAARRQVHDMSVAQSLEISHLPGEVTMKHRPVVARYVCGILIACLVCLSSLVRCLAQQPAADKPQIAVVENTIPEAFRSRDGNGDGILTEEELVAGGGQEKAALQRDFKVFDANRDGHLDINEFLCIPAFTPEPQRIIIGDPVVVLSSEKLAELKRHWTEWDKDSNGPLNADEFKAAKIGQHIRGLESMGFNDWDLDHDGNLTIEEAAHLLDIAFGVRVTTGEFLRSKAGRVVDWRGFRGLDPDGDGRVTREDFLRMLKGLPNPEEWYRNISKEDADSFGILEFTLGPNRTDPVPMFLAMDADLNGKLTREELGGIPADWGPSTKRWLAGFDDDEDGAYSLREFLLIPHVNLLATWHAANDANQDGKLSAEEFRFVTPPALAALSAEYFRRLDVNRDTVLSLDEWPFYTNHPDAKFASLDADADGEITESEFLAEKSLPEDRLKRDFKVFDADSNGRMTRTEFLTIPHWVAEIYQTQIPDLPVELSQAALLKLTNQWKTWDQDGNDVLSESEFKSGMPGQGIAGLQAAVFADWDRDHDGKVTREEAARLLDIAFGIRVETGDLVRSKSSQVADWMFFRTLDPDGDLRVTRQEYLRVMSAVPNADEWYRGIAKDGGDSFGVAEFVVSGHRTNPVAHFLLSDANLNGRIDQDELKTIPWGPPGKRWLPGFDDDGDGAYSLKEYLWLPHINLIATWHAARDANQDGMLSVDEFRFATPPIFAAVSAEYFRRLDLNRDHLLSLTEWYFQTSHPDAKFIQLDSNSDGEISEVEFLAEGNLPANRLLRDFKVFDEDGNGQMTRTEFFAIPHWVPEGQRLGLTDPVVQLKDATLAELTKNWVDMDKDQDGFLSADEFKSAALGRRVRGLEMTGFTDWDRDGDKKVSLADVALVLDIAFGIRSPTGELLRSKSGHIVDWRSFIGFNPDRNGKVPRETYVKQKGSSQLAEEWFPGIMDPANAKFGVTEFFTSKHKVDCILQFLSMDIDLDGQLSPAEMEALPAWGPPGKNWLPGFDNDGNGSYSLQEFRLIPQVNLLTTWQNGRDADNDGKLSPHEFHFMPAPSLAALSMEYFHRLDIDKDGYLQMKEWPFLFDIAKVPRSFVIEYRDRNNDGRLSLDETLGEIQRPKPGERADPGREATVLRFEEAFLRADKNDDGVLDRSELETNEGLEAIAPGASGVTTIVENAAAKPASDFLGMDGATFQTYAIIELNFLLAVGVVVYLYRKAGQRK